MTAVMRAPMNAEQKNANRRARVLIWGAAIIVILNGLFPLVWIFLTSLKPEGELGRLPITYLPHTWTLQNYATVLGFDPTNPAPKPFWRWFFNSVFIAVASSFFAVLVSSLVAYVVARMNIKGKGAILGVVAGVSMFPLITLIVPLFQTMRAAGLLNTYFALIIPYTVLSLPVCTLMMVGFFQQIPRDLENAAMVDGCTRIQSLWKVVFPLAAPGVFTAAILAFVNAWEEFLLALTLIQREDMRTLAVGITLYQGEFSFPWALISAALVLAMVPVAVVVVIFQERVVGGLTAGGVKG